MIRVNVSDNEDRVYIGIDVHKKTYTYSACLGGEVLKTCTVPADPIKFSRSVSKCYSGYRIYSVYEAGFGGYVLHRELEKFGIMNIVVNPSSVEVSMKDRVKTDRRDSKRLSEQLYMGRLRGIYIPSEQEQLQRLLTRTRDQVMKDRIRVGNRIKSVLYYFGYIEHNEQAVLTKKLLRRYEGLDFPEELSYSFKLLLRQWYFLDKQLSELKVELKCQSYEDNYCDSVYKSVPGVGEISARVLSNELGDLSKRFSNQRSVYQYIGLTPSEHSSGESCRRGHIDRQGPARLRKVLVESAWRAIKIDSSLMRSFNRISSKRGRKRAIVAIARKLIGRARSCFATRSRYCLGM